MRHLLLGALLLSLSTPSFAKKKEAAQASAGDNEVSLSLPGGLTYDRKVVDDWTAGVYAERSRGLRSGGGHGGQSSSTTDHTEVTSSSLGLQAHWTPFGPAFTDGLYLEPYLGFMKATLKSSATGYSTDGSGVTGGVIAGYGWFWDFGLGVAVGVGAKATSLHTGNTSYTSNAGTPTSLDTGKVNGGSATGELAVGWVF